MGKILRKATLSEAFGLNPSKFIGLMNSIQTAFKEADVSMKPTDLREYTRQMAISLGIPATDQIIKMASTLPEDKEVNPEDVVGEEIDEKVDDEDSDELDNNKSDTEEKSDDEEKKEVEEAGEEVDSGVEKQSVGKEDDVKDMGTTDSPDNPFKIVGVTVHRYTDYRLTDGGRIYRAQLDITGVNNPREKRITITIAGIYDDLKLQEKKWAKEVVQKWAESVKWHKPFKIVVI